MLTLDPTTPDTKPNSVMPGCKQNCAYFADDFFGIRAAIGARAAITAKPAPKQEALC